MVQVVYERCCGLDIHKKSIVACLITPGPDGKGARETRTFGTMTDDIVSLSEWLDDAGCTHVAMESTGVYWKPDYNILEPLYELLLVNAQSIKAVPGRKTDVAIEAADITLISGSLRGVVTAVDISKATMRNVYQNLFGAFIYNGPGVPVALGLLYPFTGLLLSPMLAALAMSFISVTVISNANRLKRWKAEEVYR